MNIVPITRVHEDHVRESAHFAADHELGMQENPYPEDSVAFVTWNQMYTARLRANAEAVTA